MQHPAIDFQPPTLRKEIYLRWDDFSKELICKFNTSLTSITGGARMEAISHSYVPWIHFQVWWESQTSFYCNIDWKTAFFHSSPCHGKLRNINNEICKCMKNLKYILCSAFFHADHEYTAAKDQLLLHLIGIMWLSNFVFEHFVLRDVMYEVCDGIISTMS